MPVEHSRVEQAKNVEPDSKTSKSYAQVALSVEHQAVRRKDGGLKPEAAKPFRLGVRMTRQEQDIVVRRAKEARLTISEYVRASVLGPGYVSAFDPVKRQLLRDIGRELGKQGGNLKSALKNAVQLQLLGRNPADAVKPPKAKKAAITVLTVEQSTVLLEALKPYRIYWPVLLAVSTGMRRGEILALRWKNIDFNSGTARVIESLERTSKGLRFKSPKTEKTRAVILPAHAVEELRVWKETQAKELRGYGALQSEETLVCGTREGDPMNPAQLTHVFIDCIRKFSGIVPKVRFHDLRHSHATQLLTAGIHPKIAQERLGHSTITTTLDLYSHVTNTMQADAATRLDTAFRSAMKARSNLTPKPQ